MDNDLNKFSAITTFDLKKHPFGLEMINSFFVNWPNEIKLTAYIENLSNVDDSNVKHKIIVKDYHKHIPEYKLFVDKYKNKQKYTDDFRLNAFRFAYKVYAIAKSLKIFKSKYLIWLDADIKTHKKIPITFFKKLVNEEAYLSYLGREHISNKYTRYSECGFLIFNTHHSIHSTFWKLMMEMYDGGKLFSEKEWHDSYIFDQVRKGLEKEYKVSNLNICDFGLIDINNEHDEHVFVLSILGEYMDHKKGDRKNIKWSPELIKRFKQNKS